MKLTIKFHLFLHNQEDEIKELLKKLFSIVSETQKNVKKVMATQEEHAQKLRDVLAQNEKARTEILARIAVLEAAVANAGNTTAEVDEAFEALKASVQSDDDMNEDAAEPTEPES